jgi:hypothetical protein
LKFTFGHVWRLFMAARVQDSKIIAVLIYPLGLKNPTLRT